MNTIPAVSNPAVSTPASSAWTWPASPFLSGIWRWPRTTPLTGEIAPSRNARPPAGVRAPRRALPSSAAAGSSPGGTRWSPARCAARRCSRSGGPPAAGSTGTGAIPPTTSAANPQVSRSRASPSRSPSTRGICAGGRPQGWSLPRTTQGVQKYSALRCNGGCHEGRGLGSPDLAEAANCCRACCTLWLHATNLVGWGRASSSHPKSGVLFVFTTRQPHKITMDSRGL